jgi:hypothetical protein
MIYSSAARVFIVDPVLEYAVHGRDRLDRDNSKARAAVARTIGAEADGIKPCPFGEYKILVIYTSSRAATPCYLASRTVFIYPLSP